MGRRRPHLLRRPSRRRVFRARRLLPDEAEIYVLNGLETDADPADYAVHRLKPVDRKRGRARALVGARRKRAGQRSRMRAAPRHRHEPARLRIRWRRCKGGAAPRCGERRRSPDEPFRLVRASGRSDQRGADRAVRGGAGGVSASSRLARQFVRHVPRGAAESTISRGPAMRSTAAIRRRAQPNPMRPVVTLTRRHPADALDRGRARPAATTPSGRPSGERGLRRCSRATPTVCRAGRARPTRGRGPRS